MDVSDYSANWSAIGVVVLAGAATYIGVIALTRLAGVRSLATMSSFDFAATVAVGSILSSTLLGSVSLALGLTGLALLFALQYLIASLRRRGWLHGLVDNRPVLVMAGEHILDENLRHVRLSRDELMGQLRKAGVQRLTDVTAVVMETTGDVSVLKHGGKIDPSLLRGVRGGGGAPGACGEWLTDIQVLPTCRDGHLGVAAITCPSCVTRRVTQTRQEQGPVRLGATCACGEVSFQALLNRVQNLQERRVHAR